MIDFERKLVFIHIPKTGGSAIESALLHESLGYHDYRGQRINNIKKHKLEKHFPPKGNPHENYNNTIKGIKNIEEYNIFTVVRNPWDRFASQYRYHKKLNNFSGSLDAYFSEKFLAFSNYSIDKIIGVENYDRVIFLNQENLNNEFKDLTGIDLPVVNVTSKGNNKEKYRELLTPHPHIIKAIEKASKAEINLFNYEF